MRKLLWICLVVSLFGMTVASAAVEVREPGRFDGWLQPREAGMRPAAPVPVRDLAPSDPLRVGWERFSGRNGGGWKVWLDQRTGMPSLAFGRYEKNPGLNFQPAEDYSETQIAAMRDAMTPLLAAQPADGRNTVLVGHDDPFEAATGIYPEPMGVAYVVEPDGRGGFKVLGNIHPDAWHTLAR